MDKNAGFQDLLIEVGTEELPAKNLNRLSQHFQEAITKGLTELGLGLKTAQAFATPRRLAVYITEVSTKQPPQNTLKKGPAKTAAFDQDGKPTKAALGFASSCGVSFEALSFQEMGGVSCLVFEQTKPGQATTDLLPTLVTDVLNNLPIGKGMRWGNHDFSFLRPIHWIVLLLGNTPIECEIYGVKTGNVTYGHRFHSPKPISIAAPNAYEAILEAHYVIPSFEKRYQKIVNNPIFTSNFFSYGAELIEEVTGLIEWPVLLKGSFDPAFLKLPSEVLITSMQHHQKCFPIADKQQKLLPEFLMVSNIESKDPKAVIAGNEKVIQARLADAAFYYRIDQEIALKARREDLKQVRFQQGLGSLWDKSERVAKLAGIIAQEIGAHVEHATRAAMLCKADLLTQMVGEFPELQGIMGYYYALQDKEPKEVAIAIQAHYLPRTAQEPILMCAKEGSAVALADRIDTLVGLFGIGKRPTGDKDPFSLRRQALAVFRILVERKLDLNLEFLLNKAKENYGALLKENMTPVLLAFLFERAKALYQDQGIPTLVFEAVLANHPNNPFDFHQRILAVFEFSKLKECESLAAANKRVQNILKNQNTLPKHAAIDNTLLKETAEKTLAELIARKETEISPLLEKRDFTGALKSLADLREPIDHFFDKIMVMVEEEPLRNNRLNLLLHLRRLFLQIADISLL